MSTTGHKHSSLIVSVAALCSASQTVHEYKQLILDPSPRRQSKAENTMKDNVVSAKLFDTFTNFCSVLALGLGYWLVVVTPG